MIQGSSKKIKAQNYAIDSSTQQTKTLLNQIEQQKKDHAYNMDTVNQHIDRIEAEVKKLREVEQKYGEDLENTAEEVDRCKTKQEMCKERVENLKIDCEKLELQYSKEILQGEDLKRKKREADELQIHLTEEIAKMTRTGRQPRPKPSRKHHHN